jgi:hypothetical protein
MINEAIGKCLSTSDPAQALKGFALEMSRYKYSEPTLYSGFMKKATALVGSDFLVDCFSKKAKDEDIALIQTIEKKASHQKITRDEILNYIQQGGLIDLLEKNAHAINSRLRKRAGVGELVAPVRQRMGIPGINAVGKMKPRKMLGQPGPLPVVNQQGLRSTPNMSTGVAPQGQAFLDPMMRQ